MPLHFQYLPAQKSANLELVRQCDLWSALGEALCSMALSLCNPLQILAEQKSSL